MFKLNENIILLLGQGLKGVDLSHIGPIAGVQVYSETPLSFADEEFLVSNLPNVRICRTPSEIQIFPFTRLVKFSPSKSLDDLFYKLTGREDFPFVVTVKESHRSQIREQNSLDRYHPNIELALKELIK